MDFCRPVIIFASSLPRSIVWGSVGSLYIKHQILDKVHFVCCKYYLKKRYVVPKKKRLKNIQVSEDFKNKSDIRLDLFKKPQTCSTSQKSLEWSHKSGIFWLTPPVSHGLHVYYRPPHFTARILLEWVLLTDSLTNQRARLTCNPEEIIWTRKMRYRPITFICQQRKLGLEGFIFNVQNTNKTQIHVICFIGCFVF